MERRLAAILAADVVGYSSLMGRDEAGTRSRFNSHIDELIKPVIATRRGRIVKTTGDALMVEFASVVDAVQCAIDIQKGMAERNIGKPSDKQIVFRVGVNLGDVIVEGDDIHGDGVNIAARLEAIAAPGGISVSDKVIQEIRGKLEFNSQDLGFRSLKNIAEPIPVHRIDIGEATSPVHESRTSAQKPDQTLPDKPSIVVLPFVNLSGDPNEDYFVDGLVDDFTVALGRENWLLVMTSPSTSSLKDSPFDPRLIGSELGVNYVLQGSLRRQDNRIRVVVRLSDGQNGGQIWSDRFEDEIDNVFDLQDRLMTQLVATIAPALRTSEIERAYQKPTSSLTAFDLYLQALPLFRTSLIDNRRAIGLLEKAIKLDRSYSSALGLAARCYQFQKIMAWVAPSDPCLREGVEFGRRAAELGDNNPEALWMAGLALIFLDGELDQGPALIDRSLALNPSSANAWTASCLAYSCLGRSETAIEHFYKAQRLNPLDHLHHLHWNSVALAYLGAGQIQEANDAADKTLNTLSTYPPGLRLKVAACGLLGLRDDSAKYLERLLSVQPNCSVTWLSEHLETHLRRNPDCLANFLEGARLAGLPENAPGLA